MLALLFNNLMYAFGNYVDVLESYTSSTRRIISNKHRIR